MWAASQLKLFKPRQDCLLQEVAFLNKRYDACGVPCVDGAYFTLFQREVISLGGHIVDMFPQPGGAKTLRMSRASAHEFVQNFVGVSVAKHGINSIVLGNHLCCGAYEKFGLSLPEEEALQRQHIERAVRFLTDQVELTIRHYLSDEEFSDEQAQNLKAVLESGLTIRALLIKPRDMSRRIIEPSTECFVEHVL